MDISVTWGSCEVMEALLAQIGTIRTDLNCTLCWQAYEEKDVKKSGLRHSDLLEFRGFHTKGFLVDEGSMETMVACKDTIGPHGLLA